VTNAIFVPVEITLHYRITSPNCDVEIYFAVPVCYWRGWDDETNWDILLYESHRHSNRSRCCVVLVHASASWKQKLQ